MDAWFTTNEELTIPLDFYEIYNDFKMKNGDNGQFIEIYEFVRDEKNQQVVSDNFNKLVMKAAKNVINPSYKYLKRLKKIFITKIHNKIWSSLLRHKR
jgi:hypothetical protein